MAKVWLKVITQTKTLGDALGTIWPQVVSSEKATSGVGVILSNSYCYGCHDYDCNIYLIFISIEHYLVNILVKFWASIAYVKRISTLQTFGHSQNQSKFYTEFSNILAYISHLEVSLACQCICDTQKHICMHSKQNTEWCSWLYVANNCQMRKTATLGVGVNLNNPCCYGYQSPGDNILLKFVFN